MKESRFDPRELAWGGLLGAAALVLPFLFHLVHLGKIFMPMYLPLVLLPFLVRPGVAAATAVGAPLLSALLTGMPPWYPPVAIMMAIELGLMAGIASAAWQRWNRSVLLVLVPSLLLGRAIQLGLGYLAGLLLDLPPGFASVAAVVSGLPGLILILLTVPLLVRAVRPSELARSAV